MKRKMLISIALITIMLLNCIMPLLVVNADVSSGEEIQLNSKLYNAIKLSLIKQDINFECNDITHTITLSSDENTKVTELNLNESAISDLTGIDAFVNLTHLELSGNNLSKASNLGVLNNLPALKYLDLSTNQIEDVSDIASLVESLKTTGGIILSGQTVSIVNSIYIDTEEESDMPTKCTFELPQILSLAGYLKSVWKTETRYDDHVVPNITTLGTPYIEKAPMYVTDENKEVEVTIGTDDGAQYFGMVKYTIYIYDDATEAAQANNPNKASENILNGSRFYMYYIVHEGSSEAITTMDTNLYKAIKEQLTGGQEINPNLSSYPYTVDAYGEKIFENFTYTTTTIDETSYRILTNVESNEVTYAYDVATNTIYRYNETDGLGEVVDTIIEEYEIKTTDDNGIVSIQQGYRVAFVSDECGKTLYITAYDEAKTFVIDDTVLLNKITSLILNNKQIRDLSGLEYFVGLSSDLNVSHNYLSNIEPLYDMQVQKDHWESQLVEKYNYWLKTREYGNLSQAVAEAQGHMDEVEANEEAIKVANNKIFALLKEAAELDSTKESYSDDFKAKVDEIKKLKNEIYGYTNDQGNHVNGYIDKLQESLHGSIEKEGLDASIIDVYSYLYILYDLYNNEYKLTTFLADEVNYQTYDEYETYKNTLEESTESAKGLLETQISYISNLESQEGLTILDNKLLRVAFPGITTYDLKDTDTPVSDYFSDYLAETPITRVDAVRMLKSFREIGIYSEMANYCLIKRMNIATAETYCYASEYLEARIKELEYEDIPSTLEEGILTEINLDAPETALGQAYKEYCEIVVKAAEDAYLCEGPYPLVSSIGENFEYYTEEEVIAKALEGSTTGVETQVTDALAQAGLTATEMIKLVSLYEIVEETEGEVDELVIFDQMMSLAVRLLNGNVERYVTLPDLKKLDISYNAELDNIEGISALTSLSDLNAAYCYIADVSNIDWASMTNLRRLNLGYNFISDISALTELKNLQYLNLSNNLIAGKLEITEQQYENLFEHMKELDLSGNKIDDISSLLIYLDYITDGNYANYIAEGGEIDIKLKNQKIDIVIEEPIYLSDNPTTIDVELPKIFTQLLAIDTKKTAFGETSQNGRIESEGTYVTLNTRTEGEKVAEVVVIAMTGDGTPVDTCVGEGTTATIKYTVGNRTITGMSISPSTDVTVNAGESVQFTAEVTGENLKNTKINWSVEGNTSENTTIDETGNLVVGADETSTTIKVVATSDFDKNQSISVDVTVVPAEGTNPDDTTNPDETNPDETNPDETNPDETNPDETNPDETNPDDTTNPDGTNPDDTTNPDGTNPDDTTNPDETNPDDTTVDVVDPKDLGYEAGEEFLTGINPKTPVEDFKTILLNGKEYNVVIKRDGETITEGNMATGMYVQVQDENGNVVKDPNGDLVVYEVVVNGDVNGDGVANGLDSVMIKAYRNEVTTLQGSAFEAADINKDGTVNVADSKLLLYHRAEVKGYDLNFNK